MKSAPDPAWPIAEKVCHKEVSVVCIFLYISIIFTVVFSFYLCVELCCVCVVCVYKAITLEGSRRIDVRAPTK